MKDKETIEKIKEILENGSSKFANADNPQTFKAVAEEYLDALCCVYDINDVRLNNDAIISFHQVTSTLEGKLLIRGQENLEILWHYTMVLKAFMEKFYAQAGHQYD